MVQQASVSVQKVAERFGLKIVDSEIDLRDYTSEEVFDFFNSLKKLGTIVFHGSGSQERFDIIETRRANDGAKESGNKKAVYADEGFIVPLSLAVIDTPYIKGRVKNFVSAWHDVDGKIRFEFSSNVFGLFKNKDPNIFSDGYIYILDKSNFVNAPDAGAEWHSETDQKPILTCRVSKKLAEKIFIIGQGEKDNVFEYTQGNKTTL